MEKLPVPIVFTPDAAILDVLVQGIAEVLGFEATA
jgi:hypothetical protein